jgi:hypothetical protein
MFLNFCLFVLTSYLILPTNAQSLAASAGSAGSGGGSNFASMNAGNTWDSYNNYDNLLSYLSSKNYNPYDVPYAMAKQLDSITLLVMLYRISAFDQKSSKFTFLMDVFASWRDAFNFNISRIMASNYPLDLSQPNTSITYSSFTPRPIWFPNIVIPYFRKVEQSDETAAAQNTIVTVDFTGWPNISTPIFSLTKRYVGDVSCKTDYHKYPWDTQVCSVPVVLYDFITPVKIVSKFLGPGTVPLNAMSATVTYNSKYGGWSVPVFNKRELSLSTVKAPGVEIIVTLQRQSGTSVIKQFIPLSLITVCGLLSLWVDIAVPPARVGLSITAILSLVALSFPLNADMPDAPYLTWTSIYNIICLFFAFITVVVFIIVHQMKMKIPNINFPCTKTPAWIVVDISLRYLFSVGFAIMIIVFFPVVSTVN